MAASPSASASIPASADDAAPVQGLIVLADGSKLLPQGQPRRIADSGWEIGTRAKRIMVRDADLWFSEAALPMPAAGVTPMQLLPVGVVLPDRSRIEGNLLAIRMEDGATWLRWKREGIERELRISDAGLARVEVLLRAPGVPRGAGPAEPHASAPAAAAAAAGETPPHLASAGVAVLKDGSRLVSDVVPQQLSDGSWHFSVDGRTRVLALDEVWLLETDTAVPKAMIDIEVPIPLVVELPYGQRLQGELLNSYVDSEAVWLHWRRGTRVRSLRIAHIAIAGVECEMRPPQITALEADNTTRAEQLPLLRSGADLDAFLAAQLQGDGQALESHFLSDLEAWKHCAPDARDADVGFRLAQKLGLALIDLSAIEAAPPALSALTPDAARRLRMVPLRVRQNLIAVATDNPTNSEATATIEFATGRRVLMLMAHPAAVHAAISRYYDSVEDNALLKSLVLGPETDDDSDHSLHEIERLARQQPIVRLVSGLIEDAVRRRASDIHLRPRADDFEVLFRIDGSLIPVRTFARALLRAVTSRIKVIAGMDIAEHRLPQDGRIAMAVDGADIDIRVSVLPSVNGESIVMRLLNSREGLRNLAQIGFSTQDEALFRDMLARSHGMILVTGPTGCGKSTTLYAALLETRKQDVNIITVEDPVEYHIPDVTQIQIHKAIGFSFASTLRNILRHDPDIVMLGEIRDHESAEIAVESALTGHLLLSTLHTNSAATAITRLLDLGVESFLLRSTLLGVLAQRLARRNCRQCMEPERVDPYVRAALGVGPDETFYRGIGCQHCNGTGVHGRTAVYELMSVTPAMRKLIVPDVDGDAIHDQAVSAGMVPITERALAMARAGVISLQEAYRIRVE